jgi:hypothetical protein
MTTTMILPATWPLSFRGGQRDSDRGTDGAERSESSVDAGEERSLLCAVCGAGITSRGTVTEIDGSHRHTFVNPHSYVFEIGCFSAAPGCADLGEPTTEHTWFPGFGWCFSVCANCGVHLGWRFSSVAGAVFWGLILKQLRDED